MNATLAVFPLKNGEIMDAWKQDDSVVNEIRRKLRDPEHYTSLCRAFWRNGNAYDVNPDTLEGYYVEFESEDYPMCLVHTIDEDGDNAWIERYVPDTAQEVVSRYVKMFADPNPYLIVSASDVKTK